MEFSRELRADVLSGVITVSFRLWRQARVKPGGRYRVGDGMIEVESVELIPFSSVDDADVRACGETDLESLRRRAAHAGPIHDDTLVYRIEFHVVATLALPTQAEVRVGGFSTARLERVRDVLAEYAQRGEVPGVVALLSRHGDTHVEQAGDVRSDTIFRIASMTKPVTALAAMICVEECVLRLDDPVDGYLPELASPRVLSRPDAPLDETVPAGRAITVRDLLTFTLGLGFGQGMWGPPGTVPIMDALRALGQGMPAPARVAEPDEWMRRLGSLPLVYQPGERWLYNTGSDILGVLIARATGQRFDEFLRERIFGPLGMADTGFSVPLASIDRLPPQYTTDPGSGEQVVYDPPAGQWSVPPAFPSGAGGLVSTVGDYGAFAAMLLGGGAYRGVRVLSRPSVSLMTSDQLTPAQKAVSGLAPGDFDFMGWGLGVSVVTRRTQVYHSVGTYGWTGGLGTAWFNDPAENLVLILMTQRASTSHLPPALWRDFWTAAYVALED